MMKISASIFIGDSFLDCFSNKKSVMVLLEAIISFLFSTILTRDTVSVSSRLYSASLAGESACSSGVVGGWDVGKGHRHRSGDVIILPHRSFPPSLPPHFTALR